VIVVVIVVVIVIVITVYKCHEPNSLCNHVTPSDYQKDLHTVVFRPDKSISQASVDGANKQENVHSIHDKKNVTMMIIAHFDRQIRLSATL
jgi:hypothetical protein